MDLSKKYFGPEEVLEVRETGTKTHRGVDIIEVVTRRQDTADKIRVTTITKLGFDLIATDVAKDWNYVQDAKLDVVVNQLMAAATDLGVSGSEVSPLLSRFGAALATRFEHASHLKFEGNDDEFVPGGNEFHTWSLAKAESIIVNSHPNA